MNMTLFTKIMFLKSGCHSQQKEKFEIVHHHYPTRQSENNFIKPKTFIKTTKSAISSHGPPIGNNLIDKDTKTKTSTPPCKRRLKNHLIQGKNIANYFYKFYLKSCYNIFKHFPRGSVHL